MSHQSAYGSVRRWWNPSEACSVLGKLWRGVLLGVVLAGVLAGCSLGGGSDRATSGGLRVTRADLVAKVSVANYGTKTRCSRHSKDGSRWACVVGDGMDPECYVVDVEADGSWKTEDRPPVCRFP
jgi:hypothetical protein